MDETNESLQTSEHELQPEVKATKKRERTELTVSFRISEADKVLLKTISAIRQESVHATARMLFLERLRDIESEEGITRLHQTTAAIGRILGVDLLMAVQAFLVSTKVLSAEEAKKWCKDNLKGYRIGSEPISNLTAPRLNTSSGESQTGNPKRSSTASSHAHARPREVTNTGGNQPALGATRAEPRSGDGEK